MECSVHMKKIKKINRGFIREKNSGKELITYTQ